MSKYLSANIRLIKKNGNDDYSLKTISQTTDPSNPLNVINVSSLDPILSYRGRYKTKEIDGNTIKSGDIKLYVDPSTVLTEPKIDDKITDGTTEYNIQKVDKYTDKDTVCLYILQLRN